MASPILSPKFRDLTGRRCGRLTVVRPAGKNRHGHWLWTCRCRCGRKCVVEGQSLRARLTKSCGCLRREVGLRNIRKAHTRRGLSNSPEYRVWQEMRRRCSNPKRRDWKNYGGRGVKVCPAWLRSFLRFYRDMGTRPSHRHSIDRIDNAGDYRPGNCRWATRSDQAKNRRPKLICPSRTRNRKRRTRGT